ncbi:MAG: two-component system sensor histidine kinase BarA [Francisellaceae bacterium]|jgi:two-component system sensor histidine kinase BarA
MLSHTGALPILQSDLFEKLDYTQHSDVFSYKDKEDIIFVSPVILRAAIIPSASQHSKFWERYLDNKDKRLGWVVIHLSLEQTNLAKNQSIIATIVITLLGLAISILFGLRLGKGVTNPLISIINVVRRIRDGQFDARVEIDAPGEMRSLEEGINAMAKVLMNSRNEMQENIEQATADLRETLKTIELQNTELDIARNEALEASNIKSSFLANMSHEIRTPMNGVLGFTNLLLKTKLSDQQNEFVTTIRKSSKNLLEIINNILDISKIEANKLELEQAEFTLYSVIEDAVMLIKPLALDKKIALTIHIEGDIPDIVIGDQLRLNQVITNLLGNAIKFTNNGIVSVILKVLEPVGSKQYFKIEVTDTGIGMSKAQVDNLFQAFSQADSSTTRKYGGTGLGLVISKNIIEMMQGQVGVDSQLTKGSTFWFTFALEVFHTGIFQEPDKSFGSKKALVFDQSEKGFANLNRHLKQQGLSIDLAINEEEFIDRIADYENNYDYVFLGLLDLSISDKYKTGLILDIKNFSDARLIILAHDFDYKLKSFSDSIDGCCYLSRPFRAGLLHQVLNVDEKCNKLTDVLIEEPSEIKHQNFTVLAVDDNAINLKLVAMLLSTSGGTVIKASDGKEAVKIAAESKFDLILMDIQMPIMDGYTACKYIREMREHKETPIIALSADILGNNLERREISGFTDFYAKPISEESLTKIINDYVFKDGYFDRKLNKAEPNVSDQDISIPQENKYIDLPLGIKLANGSEDMAREMLQLLMDDLPDVMNRLSTTYEGDDLDSLQSEVHKLHGGCCYCGVPILKNSAHELEANLKNGLEKQKLRKNYNNLINHIKNTLAAYKEFH